MGYSGGMLPEHRDDKEFVQQTFTFLKKALMQVTAQSPFRGPPLFKEGEWTYEDGHQGKITDFAGSELIEYKKKPIFVQSYSGGLVVSKQ
jgi:hypothetical protein